MTEQKTYETYVWVRMGCTIKVNLSFDWELDEEVNEEHQEELVEALKQAIVEGRFEPDGETYVAGSDTTYDDTELNI